MSNQATNKKSDGADWIIRSTSMPGGLKPAAEPLLATYEGTEFFHREYSLRHPVGIYRTSLERVWKRFTNVFVAIRTVLEKNSFIAKSEWDSDLLGAYENLLYSLVEHLEDCNSIMKCMFPPKPKNSWFNNSHVQNFRKAIEPYRGRIAHIVNSIKHNQSRLRSVVFYGPTWASPGYFVESALTDGAIGPDPEIHEGGNTGFSYAWDLRYHFSCIYRVSLNLADAVERLKGSREKKIIDAPQDDDKIAEIAKVLSIFPRIIFPNEEGYPYPAISYRENQYERELLIVLIPPSLGSLPILNPYKLSYSYRGDGVTNKFVIPYSRLMDRKEDKK